MSLKHAILAVLADTDRTGYELTTKMEGSVNFFWASSHQQVYKELKELLRKKWVTYRDVTQKERPDKKIYRISKTGMSELQRWICEPTESTVSKDPLLIKLFVGQHAPPGVLRKQLEGQKRIHKEKLQTFLKIEKQYFQKPENLPTRLKFQYLTLKRGILYEKGWLAWFKETVSLLKEKELQDHAT